MNELYYGTHDLPDLDDIEYMLGDGIVLQAKQETSSAFTFDDNTIIEALKRIYSQEFHPMTDIEEHLFEETLRIMLQATDEGLAVKSQEIEPEYRNLMDWNTAKWSAFKVHRMQNDIAAQLYDDNGTLKPFEQWAKDVEPMLDHHVNHWLRTEYNTAVTRAQQAADWKRFEENADIMPNLTWIPSTSAQPGADHKIYWGVTLPIDHPFWNSHRPGDRWGCKCSLENTDEEPTSIPNDPNPKQNRPADGLDNNPGKDGKLFSDSHPYIAKASKQAKKAVEKYRSEKVDFSKPIKVEHEEIDIAERRKEIRHEASVLKGETAFNKQFGKDIAITGRCIKEWLNQPHKHYASKNEVLLDIKSVLAKSQYMGHGKDKHDPTAKVHLFEIKIEGENSWVVVRELLDGTVNLHSISDREDILKILKKETD